MNNITTVTGRLTKDTEVKYFESGKVKATFTIAVDSYHNKNKFTSYINCELWDKKAEFAGEYFKKGQTITATGELVSSEWKEKIYYNLKCINAGFTGSQMVVNGTVNQIDEHIIEILTENNKNSIQAEYYGKEELNGVYTVILSLAIKDNQPIYVFTGIVE